MQTSAMTFDPNPARIRPGGLTAVCVIAIVLGVWGLGSSLLSLLSLAVQSNVENAFKMPRQPGMPEGMFRVQEEMQKKIQAITKKYQCLTGGIGLVNLIVASGLLVGGFMTMKLNPMARKLLMGAFIAAIALEIVGVIATTIIQQEMASVISEYMTKMLSVAAPKGGKNADQAMAIAQTAAKIGIYIGMAVALGWALAKTVYFGVGISYLRRPKIRQLFPEPIMDDHV